MELPLRRSVLNRLQSMGEQATTTTEPDDLAALARTEIPRMCELWRELLAGHQPDNDGRCYECTGWLRRRRWPCQVWLTAHQHLIGENTWRPPRIRRVPGGLSRRTIALVIPRQRPPGERLTGTPPPRSRAVPPAAADSPAAVPSLVLPLPATSPERAPVTPVTPPALAVPGSGIHRAAVVERRPAGQPPVSQGWSAG